MSKPTFYITTPIYYVNAAPHLGTAYTTVGADSLARYKRLSGYDVAFVGGMDEHGQKVAETAAGKGMTPQEWCDSMEPHFLDDDVVRALLQTALENRDRIDLGVICNSPTWK